MHPNSKGFTVFAIGAIFSAALLAGLSAQAAVSAVTVAEGTGYTNVVVTASGTTAGDSLTISVKNQAGAQVGDSVQATGAEGSTAVTLDLVSIVGASDLNKTYYYEVSDGTATAGAYYENVGWQSADYFSASAATGEDVRENGTWDGTAPTITSDNKYQIASTQVTFVVTATTNTLTDAAHRIIDFQCSADLESYYFLDDITNDITSATCALALVTNDEAEASASWMVLTNGSDWVAVDNALSTLGSYETRIELDYNNDPALVRYSVKPPEGSWTVLTVDGSEWIAAKASTPSVQKVCFAGQTDVASFNAKLSTSNIASVNGAEYATLTEALAAGDTVALFTPISVNPRDVSAGTWTISGKGVTVVKATYTSADTTGRTATYSGSMLTVSANKTLVAEVNDLRYFTLSGTDGAITNAVDGDTIKLVADDDGDVSGEEGETGEYVHFDFGTEKYLVLDFNGFTLSHRGIWTESGYAKLLLTSTNGGGIVNSGYTGVRVGGNSFVAIDGISSDGALIVVEDTSSLVVSNGVFAGEIMNDGRGAFLVLGGYFDFTECIDTYVELKGGRYTANAIQDIEDNGKLPTGYKMATLGVNIVTNGLTYTGEVVEKMKDSSGNEVASTSWPVTSSTSEGGTVQISDDFVDGITSSGATAAEKQAALNSDSSYDGIKKWECFVLGMPTTSSTQGPRAQGVQDAKADSIGFRMATPSGVNATSGATVQYEVEEYTSPTGTTPARTSDKVNWNENAELSTSAIDGVRYYKMKVYVAPKK